MVLEKLRTSVYFVDERTRADWINVNCVCLGGRVTSQAVLLEEGGRA